MPAASQISVRMLLVSLLREQLECFLEDTVGAAQGLCGHGGSIRTVRYTGSVLFAVGPCATLFKISGARVCGLGDIAPA